MAYNKTTWSDLPSQTTPVNATNLNNIENGIKENDERLNGTKPMGSIVVDDVNCKNMWIPTLYVGNTQILQTRCSVTLSGDTYSFVASGTDMFIGNVWTSTGNDYNGTLGTLYKVKPNTSYTLSCSNSNFSKNFITFYGSDKKSLSYQELTSNVATFTTPNNCEYITIRIGNGSATSGTTYTTTIQLEEGSTATEYVEFKQPVKITNVGVKESTTFYADDFKCKNMFIPTLNNVDSSIVVHDCTITLTDDEFTINTTGNDVYFGNVNGAGNNYANNRGVLIDVSGLSQITFTITNPIFTNNYITAYDASKKSLGYTWYNKNIGTYTIPTNAKYITFRFGIPNATSGNTYTTKIQIEAGNVATSYTPYKNFDNTLIISPLLSDTSPSAGTSYSLSDNIENYKYIMIVMSSGALFPNSRREYIPVEQLQINNNDYRIGISLFQSATVYMFLDLSFDANNSIRCNTKTQGTVGWSPRLKVYGIK